MRPEIQSNKIVVRSGPGPSSECGLPTFQNHYPANGRSWRERTSSEGWASDPHAALAFYDERRREAWQATPNAAPMAIAALRAAFDVVVVTQNLDELHERAGSRNVVHLHGLLAYPRGTTAAPQAISHRRRPDGPRPIR
jgi:NAD-dependent deacetylase